MALFEIKSRNFNLRLGDSSEKSGTSIVSKEAYSALPENYYRAYVEYSSMIDAVMGVDSHSDIVKAIKECPQVGTILANKCTAYINGKMQVLNKNPENNNPARGENGRRWQQLIDRPNILQNGKQFWANVKWNVMAFEYCPVLRVMPDGFEREKNIESLWVLPPQFTEIQFKKGIPFYETNFYDLIESITLRRDGKTWKVPKEDVYIFVGTGPIDKDGYLPTSRITGLKHVITNLVKGYKTEGRIISKPLGAFTRKDGSLNSVPIKDEDRQAVNSQFSENYGTEFDHQSDILMLNASMDWVNLMYPIGQLQIFEGRTANTAALCAGMGYPFHLFGDSKGPTFSNMDAADKTLYQNFIIPESEHLDQQIAECLFAEINGVRYETSFGHIAALQEDQKKKADVRKVNSEAAIMEFNNNGCTYNEYLVSIGRPESKQPFKDLYYWEIKRDYPEFITQNTITNVNNNQAADTGGNQGNQSGQGGNSQGQ